MRRLLFFLTKFSFSLLLLSVSLVRINFHGLPSYFADASPGTLLLSLSLIHEAPHPQRVLWLMLGLALAIPKAKVDKPCAV